MAGSIQLDAFVTAVACLCASSFRPNSNIKELEVNINKALPKWNADFLKIAINSNEIFAFAQNSMECVIPDEDTLDVRFMELESTLKKLEKLNQKMNEELNRKDFNAVVKNCESQDKTMRDCEQKSAALSAQLAALRLYKETCEQSLREKSSPSIGDYSEFYSLFINCTREMLKLSTEMTTARANNEQQLLDCRRESDNKFNREEIAYIKAECNALNSTSTQKISELNAEKEQLETFYKNELKKLQEENDSEILRLRKEAETLKAKITELQKNNELRNATTLTTCQNSGKAGLNNLLFSQQLSVFCDHRVDARFGAGWMLIAQRLNGHDVFYRTWALFSMGFGEVSAKTDFFVGLESVHTITNSGPHELLFVLTDEKNETRYAHYDEFLIGNDREQFQIKKLGKYEGDAGDSFTYHAGQKFTTWDRDNDERKRGNCAKVHVGGWWYKDCHKSNLFGVHKTQRPTNDKYKENGMIWSTFHNTDDGSLVSMQMYLRTKK